MTVEEELNRLGGVSTRATLIAKTSRREVDAAIRAGSVRRLARGNYGLPSADEARTAAASLHGTVCLASAALLLGWAVKEAPALPQVSVPRNRKVSPERARAVDLRRLTFGPDDVVDGVTSPDRTLLDSLRLLPFDEALAIADSALRDGFTMSRASALVRDARGPRVARMRHILRLADPLAANPFESVLRAIAIGVTGMQVRPQVTLREERAGRKPTFLGTPDLVDDRLRVVLEADSFEWHGSRAALKKDSRRYNAFTVNGWLVLRFSWEDVMFDQDYVASVLEAVVLERTQQLCPRCCSVA